MGEALQPRTVRFVLEMGILREHVDLRSTVLVNHHQYASGLVHEVLTVTPMTSPSSSTAPLRPQLPQALLITAAGMGDQRTSSPIGWRRQLRTADGEFVNDLDSLQSSGRGFTDTLSLFAADQQCVFLF